LSGSLNITYSAAGLNLTFVRLNATISVDSVEAYLVDDTATRFGPNVGLPVSSISTINGEFQVDASALTAGRWAFLVNSSDYGYAMITDMLNINSATTPSASLTVSSYAGGNSFIVTGDGLNPFSTLTIDGQPALLTDATTTQLTYTIPPYESKMNRNVYNLGKTKIATGTLFSDNPSKQANIDDDKTSTNYESWNATCWVGLDLGANYKRSLY
jgi:hypothetical protein